ncbi:hypothetical protein PSHT_07705 [Puccinia striiformis]|uniref:Alpha-type protein kinase domain-containing protein n=1 Tax=Puccinia striiformis TaxID=27350 RepID=A0A2S4VV98_9BASI|nr:hypothetical protein PSHT_07705 [Puccinia striiformis]
MGHNSNTNNSLSTRITAIRKNNINQTGTMYCIECGATPVCLGNWCQSCVNASASIPSTLPAVAFQPPTKKSTLPAVAIQPPTNKPKSAHEIMRLKRQELSNPTGTIIPIQCNTKPSHSKPTSQNLAIANSQAVMAQFSASGSQVISAIPSEPHLSVGPYESPPFKNETIQSSTGDKGAKAPKGPASKGIISSVSTPQKISVPCGFEMWYKGRFTTGQAVIRTNQFILWADPTSFSSLINTLCNKYNGSVELVTGPNKDRAKDQLDLEELNGMKDATQKYSLDPAYLSPTQRKGILYQKMNTMDPILASLQETSVLVRSQIQWSLTMDWSLSALPLLGFQTQFSIPKTSHGIALEHQRTLFLCECKDSNWVNGVDELNLDGLNTTQRICLYRVNYQNCLKLKSTSKIISAEILNLGTVFPMIVKYNRLQIDPNRETNFTWPNCLMRTYALARQFMAQFCQEIKSSECDKAKTIMNGFPVHHDFETRSRSDDKFIPGQDDDMLPGRVDSPDYSFYNPTLQLAEDEPSHILHGGENTGTIITHFKGNAPFIAKPRVIDLNPSSHWAHGVNTKNIISDFVQKHICTQACKRLGLPDLEEIHWSPKCGITNRESRRSASINTQKNPEDIKLISFIRQGKKALGFS